ncbi:hypothetical protein GALMADRAFT_1240640 [Galerina marginata CBS 339.88]|uniref:DUF4419 domain-containing protein n=1 Tax=Galerina marginata (strain CBS 339.88) TaxID=685588 RepID=A0A067T8L7_GALM3|nr:hypothetical protein GALMADRAFT_1240640 [Galerina marginata CBS 339.88]
MKPNLSTSPTPSSKLPRNSCETHGDNETKLLVAKSFFSLLSKNQNYRQYDVWMAILGQFNFYVNAHAEELRSHFVVHEGKKEVVVIDVGTRYTVDFGVLANRLSDEIQKNLVDKDLRNWILPNFSTTTDNDTVICSVLMMATLSAYFDRKIILRCGIPSVTLEGEKADWEKLLSRLDKLSEFGAEPTAWAALLRPILTRFVKAFDGDPDVDFWNRVCHVHPGGSGPSYLSGWITAFCVWTNQGKWQGPSLTEPIAPFAFGFRGKSTIPVLSVDDAQYSPIDTSDIPIGFCEVDIKLDDNGQLFDCIMVAGHLASLVEGEEEDSLRPAPTWFMFIKSAGWA